jgi:hypothetical protein
MPMPEACYGIFGICGTAVCLADDTELWLMAACTGSLATTNRKPRQARKGATVAVNSGAGV